MALSLKHSKVSELPDGEDTDLIRPSDWNDEHDITMATGNLLGRTTAEEGPVEELDPSNVRTLLGLAIGSDIQAWAANLDAWALLDPDNFYTSSETDTAISAAIVAALNDYYTSAEVDTLLTAYYTAAQVDSLLTSYYTSAQVDALLTSYYTSAQVDALLTDYYTSTQVDTILEDYYTETEANANFQPLNGGLTDIAALGLTKGNIIVADGTDWLALAIGADDEVLTADAAEAAGVKWATPGMVLLDSGSWSGVSALEFTGLPSGYDRLTLVLSNVNNSINNIEFGFQLSSNNGSSYITGNYTGGFHGRQVADAGGGSFNFNYWSWSSPPTNNYIELDGNIGNSGAGHSITLDLHRPFAICPTLITTLAAFQQQDSAASYVAGQGAWLYNQDAAVNAFQIFPSAGTFSGDYRLYGWKSA